MRLPHTSSRPIFAILLASVLCILSSPRARSQDSATALDPGAGKTYRTLPGDGGPVSATPALSNTGVSHDRRSLVISPGIRRPAGSSGSVLIIGDGGSENDVSPVVTAAGYTVTICAQDSHYTGTNPAATGFNAVILLAGLNYTTDMPLAGQDSLVAYVSRGGGLMSTEWIAYKVVAFMYVDFDSLVLVPRSSSQGYFDTYTMVGAQSITTGLPLSFGNSGAGNHGSAIKGTVVVHGSLSGDAVTVDTVGNGKVVQYSTAANYNGYRPFLDTNMQKLVVNTVDWFSTPAFLPIQLASFSGAAMPQGVVLDWSTMSEVNNYGFYVERRTSAESAFKTVSGLIPGSGTSLERHDYAWTDAALPAGNYRYRLRQVDLDASETHSSEIAVAVAGVLDVGREPAPRVFALSQNYPNPFNPVTVVKFSVARPEHATVKVYDVLGREVAVLFRGRAEAGRSYTLSLDAAELPSGLYLCRIVTDSRTDVKKMLLLK